jgi:hypothetical protein
MKMPLRRLAAGLSLIFAISASAANLYVDLNSPNPSPPYSDWSTAATNIQDAIDASAGGDQIWVTNGVYQSGGRVMAGTFTNRVALNKAITVQSVNGPFVTVISGASATNGNAAVRCAWLTNNAALTGFTLMQGATRTFGDSGQTSGGAVWCASSGALVSDCVLVSNISAANGSAAYQGTFNSCFVSGNLLPSNPGGGAVYSAILNNCTIVSNACAGINFSKATNSIVYYNAPQNFSGSSFSFSCTTPTISGAGNFTNAPQISSDGIHLATGSPCIATGKTPVAATDIFGNAWGNPPSVGCAESAGILLVTPPQIQLTGFPAGFTVGNASAVGTGPFTYAWLKDGVPIQDNGHYSSTQSPNLAVANVNFADAGGYQLVASNATGMATSAVAQVVIHCVNLANANPTTPYTNWDTAATNIQDAIAASAAGEIVLVTNGVYATGGKSMDNIITNRVSIDKAILVQSANGPTGTMIQGAWDPATTNGLGAIRCVWMTNNSILSGFAISHGATRLASNSFNLSMTGGGVCASSNNAMVANCVIGTNYASYYGGGAYSATLNNCTVIGNHLTGSSGQSAVGGAGVVRCNLKNCIIKSNSADQGDTGGAKSCYATNSAILNNRAGDYGAIDSGTFVNCTITGNSSYANNGQSTAAYLATLINCILYGNTGTANAPTNSVLCTFSYSDTDPLPAGTGNIDADPQLLTDQVHLSSASPCIGAGTTNGLSGTDLDGQPWNNPPSIGCDEWQPMPALAFPPAVQAGIPSHRSISLGAIAAGQPPFYYSWQKDGALIQDNAHYTNSTTANLAINSFEPEDAGAYQLIVSNSFGMATSQVAQIVIHTVDAAGANPAPPYSTWATAATQIQDAIGAASPGDIILVTNGIYTTGGKVMSGDLTNRVALDKPVTVISANGYTSTVIQGQWDSASTNGPGSVRCAWLATGAILNGFTLRNGATRGGGLITADLQYGGGAWLCTNAVVSNCVLTNNSALYAGGGIAFGTINNSFIRDNTSQNGGGAYQATLNNCTVIRNHCPFNSPANGAGTCQCVTRNSIVVNNYIPQFGILDYQLMNDGSPPSKFLYSCSNPLPSGTGNINVNPQFVDYAFHLLADSPCRGTGSSLYSSGSDLDDEPFANPPSMGCDEVIAANLTGPLSVVIANGTRETLVNHSTGFSAYVNGRASGVSWSFGDGATVTNVISGVFHAWTNAGTYTVTFTAYNVDNPAGVSTNISMTIDALNSPLLQTEGVVSNSFQFTFPAQTNANYTVQYATNLSAPVAWQTLKTLFFSPGGVITIQDPSWTNAARFYRIQAQ